MGNILHHMGALSHFKFYIVAKARRTNVRFCQPLKLKNEPSVESPFLMIINLMTLVCALAHAHATGMCGHDSNP
jgi:hypothetical protein